MVPYNTQLKQLILPEYGRNIQQMVDYCVQIPDKEERTRCAHAIHDIMRKLFPGGAEESHKIWDHINIMSEFKLDIDFPCEVLTKEELQSKPEKVPYLSSSMRFRHYGKNIERMIEIVANMEDSPEKNHYIFMIANHMKKLMITHNREGVDNARILRDLADYSNGRIVLDPLSYPLYDFPEPNQTPQQNRSRRKKKKN